MTGPEARRIGLGRALQEFEALLRRLDEVTDDVDGLTHLAVYEKEKS